MGFGQMGTVQPSVHQSIAIHATTNRNSLAWQVSLTSLLHQQDACMGVHFRVAARKALALALRALALALIVQPRYHGRRAQANNGRERPGVFFGHTL